MGLYIVVALDCENAPFVLCMAVLHGSVTSPLKRSLDVLIPVVSRIMLPKINLNSVWLRHLRSVLMGKCVASPSSNGKSWNPHTVGHRTTHENKKSCEAVSHPGLGTGPAFQAVGRKRCPHPVLGWLGMS